MDLKKITAVMVAAVMLMVCVIPMTGYDTDATDSYFVDDINQWEDVPDGYIGISSVEDLKKIGSGDDSDYGDLKFTLDAKYIQIGDIVFEDDDVLEGGIPITVAANISGSGSNAKLKVTVTTDGTPIKDATLVYKSSLTLTNDSGSAEISFTTGKSYTIVIFGTYDDGTTNHEFAVSMTIPSGTTGDVTITKNSLGNFTPIGDNTTPFTGIYDGNGYTITGMETVAVDGVSGMFGSSEGLIKNLGLVDNISLSIGKTIPAMAGGMVGSLKGGALIDEIQYGVVENCYSTGTVASVSNDDMIAYAGGVVGQVAGSTFVRSNYNIGAVSAVSEAGPANSGGITGSIYDTAETEYNKNKGGVQAFSKDGSSLAGGIAGHADKISILGSYNHGTIFSESAKFESYAGGIVGFAGSDLASNYNMGSVEAGISSTEGDTYVGGIAGMAKTIYNCFNMNTGSLISRSSSTIDTVSANVGGIAGYAEDIYNCYSYVTGSNVTASGKVQNEGGIVGSMDVTTPGSEGTITNCYYYSRSGTSSDLKALCGNGQTDLRGEQGLIIDGKVMNILSKPDEDDSEKTVYYRDPDTERKQAPSGGRIQSEMRSYDTYFKGITEVNGVDIGGWWMPVAHGLRWVSPTSDGFNYPYLDGIKPSVLEVVSQPKDIWLNEMKGDVTFSVIAYADVSITYRWQSATSITGSWSSAEGTNNESTYTIDASSSNASKYFRCQMTASYGSVSTTVTTDAVKIYTQTYEIKTVQDLLNISKKLDGSYTQMNDIYFDDKDLNGGLDMTVKAKVDSGKLNVTVLYNEDKPAKGLYVMIGGEYAETDAKGVATITYDSSKEHTMAIFGLIGVKNVAVQYDLDKGFISGEIEASSNGNFDPIGTFLKPFTGTYDGNGYSIYGLKTAVYSEASIFFEYDGEEESILIASSGLFGYVSGCEIKGLSIKDSSSLATTTSQPGGDKGSAISGGIVGIVLSNDDVSISDCSNSGSVTSASIGLDKSSESSAGGIVGTSMEFVRSIDRCSNSGKIEVMSYNGSESAGGIIVFGDGDITDCYNTGPIVFYQGTRVGGIAYYADNISNCYSTAPFVSGMSGIAYDANAITNCYFLGVSGDKMYDAVEYVDGGETQRSGPKTAAELKNKATYYTNDTVFNDGDKVVTIKGWNFSDTWKMDSNNNGYPYLKAVDHKGGDDGDGGIDTTLIIAGVAAVAVVILAAVYLIRRRA